MRFILHRSIVLSLDKFNLTILDSEAKILHKIIIFTFSYVCFI